MKMQGKQSGFVAEYIEKQNKKIIDLQARNTELEKKVEQLKEELWSTAEWLEKQDSIAANEIADSIKQALQESNKK